MMRRLSKLDRADARLRARGIDPLDAWHRERDPRATRSDEVYLSPRPRCPAAFYRRASLVIGVLTVCALVALAARGQYFGSRRDVQLSQAGHGTNRPSVGVGERGQPLGSPRPAPAGAGGYRFLAHQAGGSAPVTWDPCREIHYVVSGSAPAGEDRVLSSAFAEVSSLTGFRFVADGTTDERPDSDRDPYQPGRYGDRWAPVLVAWTDPAAVPDLAGHVIGLGGGTPAQAPDGLRTYVSGIVFLDKPAFARAAGAGEGEKRVLRAVVLHEIGHLVGLDHVANAHSVMYPESQLSTTDFSAGDRRGLAAVAHGRCAPQL